MKFSRRDFLKRQALFLTGIAISPKQAFSIDAGKGFSPRKCFIAGTWHPNVEGARNYFEAVMEKFAEISPLTGWAEITGSRLPEKGKNYLTRSGI